MPSLRSHLLYQVVKYQLAKLAARQLALPQYRLAREAAAQRMFRMPADATVEVAEIGGCAGEWLHAPRPGAQGVVLYLHGGAYTGGSCITHRAVAARLARAAGHSVFNLAYRLAPEHPFPAALDDALAAYQGLLAVRPGSAIALAGDSAGAALALAVRLREQGVSAPAALALMSPWTDLTLSHATHSSKARVDPYFPSRERLQLAARHYAGATALDHPLLSPHFAQLHELPPTLIHVGEREALLDDSLQLAKGMSAKGSQVSIKVFPGMWHVWQMLGGWMPEADQSLWPLERAGLIADRTVIVDSKSGVSGAGRSLGMKTHFGETHETFSAYSVGRTHRHLGEMEQETGLHIIFSPHLLPVYRGILSTIYVTLQPGTTLAQARAAYTVFADEPFIKLLPEGRLPELRHVQQTMFLALGLQPVEIDVGRYIIVAALDNLLKGASGQAVQNMNLMLGFAETMGL